MITHLVDIFDLFVVVIFDRMEAIGDFVRDVLLRDYRPETDDLFSLGSAIIGPLLRDAELLSPPIWKDAAGPRCSQHTHCSYTIIHSPSRRLRRAAADIVFVVMVFC
jgi:hypothetical protein